MSLFKVYRYEDLVLFPRMVLTDAGVFLETEPVDILGVENLAALVEHISKLLSSKPAPAEESDLYREEGDRFSAQSVLLTALSIKKWHDFERQSLLYTIHLTEDDLRLHVTGRGDNGLWSIQKSSVKSFPLSEGSSALALKIVNEIAATRPTPPPRLLGGGGGGLAVRPPANDDSTSNPPTT